MADKEFIATGRRKTSIAVVKLVKGKGRIFVNGKTLREYIGNRPAVEMMLYRPLVLTENQEKYDVRVKAVGGGVVSQAGAIRHGIARALVKVNEEYKSVLKAEGLLTRDPRVKERKKYGQKRGIKTKTGGSKWYGNTIKDILVFKENFDLHTTKKQCKVA